MDIEKSLKQLLEESGYSIYRDHVSHASFLFENDSVLGHVRHYESVDHLITQWGSDEKQFLTSYAHAIRFSGTKSWNLYTVLTTQPSPSTEERDTIVSIEDNLRATRKICAAGISEKSELATPLLPLLSLQNSRPSLADFNFEQELRQRIGLSKSGADALLLGDDPDAALDILLREQ